MPTLVSIKVENLLGRFSHSVDFSADWDFVIVHGPNGVGKTKLLELVNALSRNELSRLSLIPFEAATLTYHDGTTLSAHHLNQVALPGMADETVESPHVLRVVLERPNTDPAAFVIDPTDQGSPELHRRRIEHELPVERRSANVWMDFDHGDLVTFAELKKRYSKFLPQLADPALMDDSEAYDAYREFVEELSTHLIETQRLLEPTMERPGHRARDVPSVQMTVLKYSEQLQQHLSNALADNSTTSQRLDRTFPERVLNAPEPEVTDEQIRERYAEQLRLRDRLAEVSLLEESATLPLPDRALAGWELRVLSMYLDDADEKLSTFKPLLDRLQLLTKIVNSRFLFKKLVIDRHEGFKFQTDSEGDLGPAALSSGEQHELVLAYDLLFNVDEGSLVLIDEPEISLHVSWQQKFLDDLTLIAELQSLRFLIATHSPQVIHNWWNRARALYDDPSYMGEPELRPNE